MGEAVAVAVAVLIAVVAAAAEAAVVIAVNSSYHPASKPVGPSFLVSFGFSDFSFAGLLGPLARLGDPGWLPLSSSESSSKTAEAPRPCQLGGSEVATLD